MSRAFLSGATIQGTDVAGVLGISTKAAGAIGIVVKGFTGQTASLQEWRNVGDTPLAKVDAAGAFLPPHIAITAAVSPTTALIIAGSTGLASGLNSASAVSGIVTVPTNAGTGQIQGVSAQPTSTGSSLNLAAYIGSVRFAHASLVATSGRVFEAASPIITAGGTITTMTGLNILAQKITGVTTGYGINQQGSDDLNAFAGRTTITSGNAAYVPLTVKGAASQSASLLELKDSANVVLARVTPEGHYVEKVTTFTPTAAGWYRIAIGANLIAGTVSIKGTMDVYQTDMEFEYSVVGYTLPGFINLTRWTNYNGGVVTQIRTSSDGVSQCYLDIYIAPSGITYGPVTVHARGMHQTALVAAPVVGAVAGSSTVNVLTVGGGFRSTAGANFAEVSGNVGIGVASPTGKLSVTNTVAGTAAVIIKAAAAQTAPLTEWRSSANALVAMVRSDGLLGVPYVRDPTDTGPFFSMQTDTIVCTPPAANLCPLTVRGYTSQSNHLQQWQNSAAGMLSGITAGGALDFASTVADKIFLYGRTTSSAFGFGIQASRLVAFVPPGSAMSIRPTTTVGDQSSGAEVIVFHPHGSITQTLTDAASIGSIIKGAAAQTANLSEWRTSADLAIVSISSAGHFGVRAAPSATSIVLVGSTAQTLASASSIIGVEVVAANSGTGGSTGAQIYGRIVGTPTVSSARGVTAGITASGASTITSGFGVYCTTPGLSGGTVGTAYGAYIALQKTTNVSTGYGIYQDGAEDLNQINGRTTVTAGAASYVPLLLKGAASQTGPLTEWRSSANALLASVRPDGEIRTVSIRDVAGTSAQLLMSPGASVDGIVAYAGTAAAVVFQVRGQTVQTGDLQQWHNNFIVLGRVTADGKFGLGSAAPTARLNVAGFTDILQMLVKGHSTQTASLQEWQNSGGTVLAKIDSGGRLTATNWVVSSTAPSSPATNDVWIDTSS